MREALWYAAFWHPQKEKPPQQDGLPNLGLEQDLLDLAFFVFNVLACHGVVFLNNHFLGHGARVLFGHIEMARISSRIQPYLDRCRFRHFSYSISGSLVPPVKS
jgi:hypothetical protein